MWFLNQNCPNHDCNSSWHLEKRQRFSLKTLLSVFGSYCVKVHFWFKSFISQMEKQISDPAYQGNTRMSGVSDVPDTKCLFSEWNWKPWAFIMESTYQSFSRRVTSSFECLILIKWKSQYGKDIELLNFIMPWDRSHMDLHICGELHGFKLWYLLRHDRDSRCVWKIFFNGVKEPSHSCTRCR